MYDCYINLISFRKFFRMRQAASEYKRESTEDGRNAKQGF